MKNLGSLNLYIYIYYIYIYCFITVKISSFSRASIQHISQKLAAPGVIASAAILSLPFFALSITLSSSQKLQLVTAPFGNLRRNFKQLQALDASNAYFVVEGQVVSLLKLLLWADLSQGPLSASGPGLCLLPSKAQSDRRPCALNISPDKPQARRAAIAESKTTNAMPSVTERTSV